MTLLLLALACHDTASTDPLEEASVTTPIEDTAEDTGDTGLDTAEDTDTGAVDTSSDTSEDTAEDTGDTGTETGTDTAIEDTGDTGSDTGLDTGDTGDTGTVDTGGDTGPVCSEASSLLTLSATSGPTDSLLIGASATRSVAVSGAGTVCDVGCSVPYVEAYIDEDARPPWSAATLPLYILGSASLNITTHGVGVSYDAECAVTLGDGTVLVYTFNVEHRD